MDSRIPLSASYAGLLAQLGMPLERSLSSEASVGFRGSSSSLLRSCKKSPNSCFFACFCCDRG